MKKLIALFTCFCLLSLSLASFALDIEHAGDEKTTNSKSQTLHYLNEEDVFNAIAVTYQDQNLLNTIDMQSITTPSGVSIDGFNAVDYNTYTNDQYGGMYVNDAGELVLCYVKGSDELTRMTKKVAQTETLVNEKNDVVAESVVVKSVMNSYAKLENVNEQLIQLWDQYDDIYKFYIDVINNKVTIEILSNDNYDRTAKELTSLLGKDVLNIVKTSKQIGDVTSKTSINGAT